MNETKFGRPCPRPIPLKIPTLRAITDLYPITPCPSHPRKNRVIPATYKGTKIAQPPLVMTPLGPQLLRLALCLSLAVPSSAFAAESATPPTQTGGGGGDRIPPSLPPTKYFGSGGENDGGAPQRSAKPRTFDVYQLDPVRNPIYFEGQQAVTQDAHGKEIRYQRVFQFLNVTKHTVGAEIRRGLLIPDGHYLDSNRIEWGPNQYSLGELMLEIATEKAKNFRRTMAIRGPITHTAKGAFELYLVAPDGFDVYFEGKKDSQGRERVFRQTLNSAYVDRGYIENIERGKVQWSEPNVPRGKALSEISQAILSEAPQGIRNAVEIARAAQPNIIDPRAGRQYPNYPEVKNPDRSPLPRNRSLVITDGITRDGSPYQRTNPPPSGSGRAEVSSPYRGTLNPLTETYGQGWSEARPSNLHNLLEWSEGKGRRLRKSVFEYVDGGQLQQAGKKTAKRAGTATAQLGRTSFNFYLAMGLLAGYELAMHYSDNPRAWTAFLDTGTDPVFYLSLGAFMAASHPFFRSMGPLNGPVRSVLPRFTGAIVVGGLASHIVSQILYDPNFRKCYGFTSYGTTGKFVRDLEACDKLYEKWANYELDKELLPLITNLSSTAGIFYGSLRALKAISQRTAVQNVVSTTIRVFKIPPSSFARGDVRIVGMMALFLGIYELNQAYLNLGGQVSDMFLKYNPDIQYPLRASYDFLVKGQVRSYINEYGNSLDDSEKRVLKEWKRIHEAKFKNPYLWDKLCADSKRNDQIFYNCDAPDQYMFDAVIKRYGEVQLAWREAKMKPTMDVFNTWSKKVHAYNSNIAMSYTFYKALLSLKAQALKAGNKDFQMDAPTTAALRTLINEMAANLSPDFKNAWSYVMPKDYFDFMITSATCGPEAEPFGQTGRIGSIYNYFFAKSPTDMAKDSMWSDIQFFPPRITQALPGNGNLCDKPNEGVELLPRLGPRGSYSVADFPYNKSGGFESWGSYLRGENYARGLDKYLMANIRDSIMDEQGNDRFNEWWTEHVLTPHEKLQLEFRKEYEKMLNARYVPALTDKGYTWCEANPADLRIPSLQKHLRSLGRGADCTSDATHRLAIGVFNSLEDELRLYSALILDLHQSVSGRENKDLQDTLLAAAELLEDMQTHLTTVNRSARSDLKDIEKRFGEIVEVLNIHHKKLTEGRDENWLKANSHIALWTRTLQNQFGSVFVQAAEYTKVLVNFEVAASQVQQ